MEIEKIPWLPKQKTPYCISSLYHHALCSIDKRLFFPSPRALGLRFSRFPAVLSFPPLRRRTCFTGLEDIATYRRGFFRRVFIVCPTLRRCESRVFSVLNSIITRSLDRLPLFPSLHTCALCARESQRYCENVLYT